MIQNIFSKYFKYLINIFLLYRNDKGDIKDNFFAFDFDLKELKMLKRRQVRSGRDPNYDFQYSFVDFDEFVSIAKSMGVGIAPEIKSPTAVNKVTYQIVFYT